MRLAFEERVNRDPMLRALVDHIVMVIDKLQLTPTEVREAAVYACLQHEMLTCRTYRRLVPESTILEARDRVDGLQAWLDEWERPKEGRRG